MYLISGNHDSWYSHMGADIVEEICSERPNMTYLGYNQADIDIGGATLRLFHGTDGGSRTLSYRLQLLSESYTIGKKPNILLAGHTHKMCYIFDRMIHCVSVPSLQMQTSWMASKKLAAHTGFLIIEFDTNHNGVCNFQFRYYPFYA
jgi:predicted phosphodiesterase